jgi:cytochrome b
VPDNGLMAVSPDKKIQVWDLPVRFFHWTLVILMVVSYFTGKAGKDWMTLHFWSGYGILTLLIFRIVWGFVGSTTARFSNFVKGPSAGIHHLREMFLPAHVSVGGPREAGHNPVGGAMVVVLIVAVLAQAAAGLFSVDTDTGMVNGPLYNKVASATAEQITAFHKFWVNVLIVLAGLHILAAIVYLVWKRQNLIGAMFTGTKPARHVHAPDALPPVLAFASNGLAISLLVASAALVYFIVRLGS